MNFDDTTFKDGNAVFFARVSREISHELSNVTAVIGELSGLMGDLAAAGREGRPPALEKIEATAAKIDGQTLRAKEIIGHFNRFAHSLDVPFGELDLVELLRRFSVLARRPLERRRAALSLDVPDGRVTLTSNAFMIYRMLFSVLDQLMDDGTELAVLLGADKDAVEICFKSTGGVPLPESTMDAVEVAARLNGAVCVSKEGDGWVLRLPLRSMPLPVAENQRGIP